MRSTTLVLFFFIVILGCRNSASKEIKLNGVWRSSYDDSLSFSNLDYRDDNWKNDDTIRVDPYVGAGVMTKWFRYNVFIPERSQWPINAKKLQFFFSILNADDEFFLNGHFIGSNGVNGDTVSIKFGVSQFIARTYELSVNDSLIHWGKDNVIALRIKGKRNAELLTKNGVIKSSEFTKITRRKFASDWRVTATDSLIYAIPSLEKKSSLKIKVGKFWESQGLPDYDGYVWYWKTFFIVDEVPASNSRLRLSLGKIDDNDQVFLDGSLIGENGKNVRKTASPISNLFSSKPTQADLTREYTVELADRRFSKRTQHSIAVRVFDSGGDGGMLSEPYYSILNANDGIRVDLSRFYRINYKNELDTVAIIYNDSPIHTFKGSVSCVLQKVNFEQVKAITSEVRINPRDSVLIPISLGFSKEELNLYFIVDHATGSNIFYQMLRLPFILTK